MRGPARRRRLKNIPSEALIIREWALQLLGTRDGPSESLWADSAAADPSAWDLFLQVESAALPIQSELGGGGGENWSRLPARIVRVIREAATWELRHVLSARAQLRTIARLAGERDWRVVVLKGGAVVAAGELLFLGDVDILVGEDEVDEVAAALDEIGYQTRGRDTETSHHLAARTSPGGVRVEVHRSIKGGPGLDAFQDALLPLEGEPELRRLGPADGLRYQLAHSVIQHPERIGKIRELLLIGHTLVRTPPDLIREFEEEVRDAEGGELYRRTLLAARELRERSYSGDHLGEYVRRIYILYHRFGRHGGGRLGDQVLNITGRILGRGPRHWWRIYLELRAAPTDNRSAIDSVARIQGVAPKAAFLIRHLLRLTTFGLATLQALLVVGEAQLTRGSGRAAPSPSNPAHHLSR